jgi:hypothetical protein
VLAFSHGQVAVQESQDMEEDVCQGNLDASAALAGAAEAANGFSGRMLRKLPFLAHAKASALHRGTPPSCLEFARLIRNAADNEARDRQLMIQSPQDAALQESQ